MSLKGLPYKKKNLYLLFASIAFMLIVYFMAIHKTIILYQENNKFKEKKRVVQGTETDLAKLQERLIYLNKYFNQFNTDSLQNPQFILESVSNLCRKHHVVLKKFPKPEVIRENDFIIETNVIETEGTFINLLLLVNDLEKINNIGRISSVTFQSYKDSKSKRLILSLVIYLQCIKLDNGNTII